MPATGLWEQRIPIPDGVRVVVAEGEVWATRGDITLRRALAHPQVEIAVEPGEVVVRTERPRRKVKAVAGTFAAHIRNLVRGVTDGFEYRMKIVYSHFPMKASVKGDEFIIENFLGEKRPRKARIVGQTKVEVQGDAVVLHGPVLEEVSQSAANIERATHIKGFDPRVFQDGIYIVSKAGEGP